MLMGLEWEGAEMFCMFYVNDVECLSCKKIASGAANHIDMRW